MTDHLLEFCCHISVVIILSRIAFALYRHGANTLVLYSILIATTQILHAIFPILTGLFLSEDTPKIVFILLYGLAACLPILSSFTLYVFCEQFPGRTEQKSFVPVAFLALVCALVVIVQFLISWSGSMIVQASQFDPRIETLVAIAPLVAASIRLFFPKKTGSLRERGWVRLMLGCVLSACLALFLWMITSALGFETSARIAHLCFDASGITFALVTATMVLYPRAGMPRSFQRLFFPVSLQLIGRDPLNDLIERIGIEKMEDSLVEILDRVLPAFQEIFAFEQGCLSVLDRFHHLHVHTYGHQTASLGRLVTGSVPIVLLNHCQLPTWLPGSKPDIIWLEDLERGSFITKTKYQRVTAFLFRTLCDLKEEGFQLFIPISFAQETVGLLVLGPRRGELAYNEEHIELIQKAVLLLSMAILNRFNSEEVQDFKIRSQRITQFFAEKKPEIQRTLFKGRSLIYQSTAMRKVMESVERAANTNHPVLITGETGTGKELFARLIQDTDRFRSEPFIAVNSAALSANLWEDELFGHVRGAFTDAKIAREGRVAEAGNGILFFDEIGDMPFDMQAKMLRLLQEGDYYRVGSGEPQKAHCRFVFATNRDLPGMVAQEKFREDLYYRISVFHIELPSLRQRREDIILLVNFFIDKYAKELGSPVVGIEQDAMDIFMRYRWPGNVRELENVLIRAIAGNTSEVLTLKDLPLPVRESRSAQSMILGRGHTRDSIPRISAPIEGRFEELMHNYEKTIITHAMYVTKGNKSEAARVLGIKRGKLLYQIKELHIENGIHVFENHQGNGSN